MKIKIPEKSISTYKDGKKFTTYTDEKIVDYPAPCPCCEKDMSFSSYSREGGWGFITLFNVNCEDCKLTFEGINDNHEFLDEEDFVKFVLSRLGMRK